MADIVQPYLYKGRPKIFIPIFRSLCFSFFAHHKELILETMCVTHFLKVEQCKDWWTFLTIGEFRVTGWRRILLENIGHVHNMRSLNIIFCRKSAVQGALFFISC